MPPHTDSIRTSPIGLPEGTAPPAREVPLAMLTVMEGRRRTTDRTALCVQITLCIVVAALLFSVIALPKIRNSAERAEANPGASQPAKTAP